MQLSVEAQGGEGCEIAHQHTGSRPWRWARTCERRESLPVAAASGGRTHVELTRRVPESPGRGMRCRRAHGRVGRGRHRLQPGRRTVRQRRGSGASTSVSSWVAGALAGAVLGLLTLTKVEFLLTAAALLGALALFAVVHRQRQPWGWIAGCVLGATSVSLFAGLLLAVLTSEPNPAWLVTAAMLGPFRYSAKDTTVAVVPEGCLLNLQLRQPNPRAIVSLGPSH
jgi:hypothetical protein